MRSVLVAAVVCSAMSCATPLTVAEERDASTNAGFIDGANGAGDVIEDFTLADPIDAAKD